ncbi:MAG: EamA family transporter, partial [Burkholderiaceae bacterium]|nr:EamA family transporter [Burkholderiaceae bacterium]
MSHGRLNPVVRGGVLALLAAALFGLSTPFVQAWGQGVGPFTTAALLYAGAALIAVFLRKPKDREAQLQPGDAGRLLAMALFGAVIGPVALVWGLQRTSGVSASLMLTLEAVVTALLAWRLYGETMDRRVVLAMGTLLAGGLVLALDQGFQGGVQLMGLLAVMAATVAWGIDNTLSRGVADRDPGQVVLVKAVLGLSATGWLAWWRAEPLPAELPMVMLLLIGASGYGLSLRFYLLAQRAFGAARTGSVFAFAPFIGAVAAFALGERTVSPYLALGGLLMLMGVLLHLAESHAHEHGHEWLEHEHAHRHDDGHHTHSHTSMPSGPHSHWHRHDPLTHTHAHVPDIHHGHT